MKIQVQIPPKLIPVFAGKARYRGSYGGRGSAKTRTFATMLAIKGMMLAEAGKTGVLVCGREFMNSLSDSSMAEVKAAIKSLPWLERFYDIGEKYIRTRDGRISFVFIGLRHNLESIKSKSKIHILWIDEAETISEIAWGKITPTVREEESEIWVTWNPEREESATHLRFRSKPADYPKIIEMNYNDNPWFPKVLEEERLRDLSERPEQYGHVWHGEFKTVVEGAYFAPNILKAREEGRISVVAADPLMTVRAVWDIGGTGQKADACAIWIVQYVGLQVRVLKYYEAVGQELCVHVAWLRHNGFEEALMVLPHDGRTNDKVHDVSYESELIKAGFKVKIIPNQGAGAAMMRVEATRKLFGSIWFDESSTKDGLKALGWYHEKRCSVRNIGLGPNHDWSSHGSDAFGYMAIDHADRPVKATKIIYNTGYIT